MDIHSLGSNFIIIGKIRCVKFTKTKGIKDTMADLTLTRVGNDREKLIQLIYQKIGLEEKEAKAIVERIEKGHQFLIHNIPQEQVLSIKEIFLQNEVAVEEIQEFSLNPSMVIKNFGADKKEKSVCQSIYEVNVVPELEKQETQISVSTEVERSVYQPIYDANIVSGLGRQETMEVLKEVEKIVEELENDNEEMVHVIKKLEEEKKKEEAIRNHLSGMSIGVIVIAIILGIVVGMMGLIPVAAVIIIGACASKQMIDNYDLEKNKEKNNQEANQYAAMHIYPLLTRLDEIEALRDDIIHGGKLDWALDIVGKDLLYLECIQDLYNFVKSRRADNLKEALNKYDDELYKSHMEEIQKATQEASEAAAVAAIRQNEKLKQIERNTNDAARAAEISAILNYGTYENTRRINRKLR